MLEIGGSHAYCLRPLIENLGIITLIITDIDSVDPNKRNSAVQPKKNNNYKTGNTTLKTWLPKKENINDLLKANISKESNTYPIRVAYQFPKKVEFNKKKVEAIPYTFEDALVFENINIFNNIDGTGLIKKFNKAIKDKNNVEDAGKEMFEALKDGKKAEFALNLLFQKESDKLNVPLYIKEGLIWLQEKLDIKQKELLTNDIKKKKG